MVLTLIYMPTIRIYRALVALGLPTSSSPPCQFAWTKCLTGCGRIAYSWTLRKQRSAGVRPLVGRTICHLLLFVSERTTCCPRQRQRCRYAVSCVAYGVRMFRCVTTAPQHHTLSVRFCVPFAGRVAGYATSRLLQRNTRRTSCVSAQSTLVASQCRRQTDTSIFTVWACQTSHQCCETYTGCGLRNASISS